MKLYTVKQAAPMLGISEYALRLGVRTGRFPCFRPTSSGQSPYLINVDLVEEIMRHEMLAGMQKDGDED